jgi:hypothetical protein
VTRVLGIPAPAHREALLHGTAGGGRVPLAWSADGGPWSVERPPQWIQHTLGYVEALILHDSSDPEAGAMGLARLAWVAVNVVKYAERKQAVRWKWAHHGTGYRVGLDWCADDYCWTDDDIPAIATATHPAHAVGLVCVHLGLLSSVEVA